MTSVRSVAESRLERASAPQLVDRSPRHWRLAIRFRLRRECLDVEARDGGPLRPVVFASLELGGKGFEAQSGDSVAIQATERPDTAPRARRAPAERGQGADAQGSLLTRSGRDVDGEVRDRLGRSGGEGRVAGERPRLGLPTRS